jgi:hypothetical protein
MSEPIGADLRRYNVNNDSPGEAAGGQRAAFRRPPDLRGPAPWMDSRPDPRQAPAPLAVRPGGAVTSSSRIPTLEPEWMPPMPPLDLGGRRRLIGFIGRLAAIGMSIALIVLVALVATRPQLQSEFNRLVGGWFNSSSNDAAVPQAATQVVAVQFATAAATQQSSTAASAGLPLSVSDAMAQMPAAGGGGAAVATAAAMTEPAAAAPAMPAAKFPPVAQAAQPSLPVSPSAGVVALAPSSVPDAAKADISRASIGKPDLDILVTRAEGLVKQGDFASARLLLRRAAEARSAAAALALGATYDPAVLKKIGAIGTVPDPAQARQWYVRAADLGSSEAQRRLDAMMQ